MAKNISVIGIYPDRITLADAIGVLRKRGYRATDIAVLVPDNPGTKDFAHSTRTKAREGAAWGAAVGALAGATLAWVAATHPVPFAGSAWLVSAGPDLALLAGTGSGGAVGWIVGFLAGLGRVEYVARRYAGRIRDAGILLSIHCDSPEWRERAKVTLKDTGARNVSSSRETAADFAATDTPTERAPCVSLVGNEAPGVKVQEPVDQASNAWVNRTFVK